MGWARGKIPIPASQEGSHHLGLLMEVDFPLSQFSGKTFLKAAFPPLESAWESSSRGKLCLGAVCTQGLQLGNRNRCHRGFLQLLVFEKHREAAGVEGKQLSIMLMC